MRGEWEDEQRKMGIQRGEKEEWSEKEDVEQGSPGT